MFTNDAEDVRKLGPGSNGLTGGPLSKDKPIACEGPRFRFQRRRLSFAKKGRVIRLDGACRSRRDMVSFSYGPAIVRERVRCRPR